MLDSVEAIVEALGGNARTAALAGLKTDSAVSNWKANKRIPPENFFVFSQELAKLGLEADRSVFGFKPAETV